MTIPTKVNEEKPKEAQVLINPETVVKVEFKQAVRDAAEKQQRRVHAAVNKLIQYRRRRYMAVTVAVAIASFLVVVAGICGGIYVYKWIFNSRRIAQGGYMPQGGCVVPYHDDVRIDGYAQRQVQARVEPSRALQSTLRPRSAFMQPYGARGSFEEKYNVLNSDQEVLQVPQLGIGAFDAAPMTIIHDFTAKLTAIVDTWNERCFVKPLDPSVVPPRDLLDLMRRISEGSYVPNVCLIRKHYRADPVPLDVEGMTELGSTMVLASCSLYNTYRLVPINAPTVTLTSTLPPAVTPSILSELVEGDDEDEDEDDEDIDLHDMEDEDIVDLQMPQEEDDVVQADEDVEVANENVKRVKRSVDVDQHAPVASVNSQVPDEDAQSADAVLPLTPEIPEADDMLFNVGFAGSDTVELAVVHFN